MHSVARLGTASADARIIEDWLISYIADLMEISPSQVHSDKSFSWLGLDSVSMAVMAGELGNWIGREIDVSVIYEHRTIARLSKHLSSVLRSLPAAA